MFHSRSSSWESLKWVVKFPPFWKETNCSSFPCQPNFGPQLQPPRAFGGGGIGRSDGHLPYGWRRRGRIHPENVHFVQLTSTSKAIDFFNQEWKKMSKTAYPKIWLPPPSSARNLLIFRKWSFQTGGMMVDKLASIKPLDATLPPRRRKCQKILYFANYHFLLLQMFSEQYF